MKTLREMITLCEGMVPNPEVEKAKAYVLKSYPDAKFVTTSGNGSMKGNMDLVVTTVLAEDVESHGEGWILAAKRLEDRVADSFRAEQGAETMRDQGRDGWM